MQDEQGKRCCVQHCEVEATVQDRAEGMALKILVPFCQEHFDLWVKPTTVGKDVGSLALERLILYPAIDCSRAQVST